MLTFCDCGVRVHWHTVSGRPATYEYVDGQASHYEEGACQVHSCIPDEATDAGSET